MAAEPNAVEQAVSRTLRDNLEKIQRTADELHQAVNDMVAACASSRASNALPSMVRAQTSAAALSATLEVLSRFVTSALQPPMRLPFEPDILRVPSMGAPPVAAIEQPPPAPSHLMEEISWAAPAAVVRAPTVSEIAPPVEQVPAVPTWSRRGNHEVLMRGTFANVPCATSWRPTKRAGGRNTCPTAKRCPTTTRRSATRAKACR